MIFSQYIETCEVLLDYPKIVGDDVIEDYAKKAIRNLFNANFDVHGRRLIAEYINICMQKVSDSLFCIILNNIIPSYFWII